MTYADGFIVALLRAKMRGACEVVVRGDLYWYERWLLRLAGIKIGRCLWEKKRNGYKGQ